jgi:hypothetical protein
MPVDQVNLAGSRILLDYLRFYLGSILSASRALEIGEDFHQDRRMHVP